MLLPFEPQTPSLTDKPWPVGMIFVGCYDDPNHPTGYKRITMTGDLDDDGNGIGHCEGRDTKDGEKYLLPALASRDGLTDKIVVDFSPKGGPSDLSGVYNRTEIGVTWEDGNTWVEYWYRICPPDAEETLSLEFL